MNDKYCDDCAHSRLNNGKDLICVQYRKEKGIYRGRCEDDLPYYKLSPNAYPKTALFMEAVEWMEKGNKAVCPHGQTLEKGSTMIVYAVHRNTYVLSLGDIQGEWKLLAPALEKTEEDKATQELVEKIEVHIEEMKKLVNQIRPYNYV